MLALLVLIAAGMVLPPSLASSGPLARAEQELGQDLRSLLGDTRWRAAQLSVMVTSLDRGDTLFTWEPDEWLAPASNVKLFTTAAALHRLGADFRFRTFLLSEAPIHDGVLEGDLVLYGTGDPSISDRLLDGGRSAFDAMADELVRRGVREVGGDVVGDGSYFQGPSRHPEWEPDDLNDWYAAPVGGLIYNENVVTLRIRPSQPWHPPIVETLPPADGLRLENAALTVPHRPRARDRIAVLRDRPEQPIRIQGELAFGGGDLWRRMTIQDPARFAAGALAEVLRDRGIRVRGEVRAGVSTGPDVQGSGLRPAGRVLALHRSPPLAEIVEVVNKVSHNLFAESLLMVVRRVAAGEGSFRTGTGAVERFLVETAGLNPTGLHLADGSGLSASNRASASHFVSLFSFLEGETVWESYWESLPEAGNSRELGRMYRSRAARNLRAKTGTIRRVSALSGVVRSRQGERLAFSILANGVRSESAAKRLEDRIGIRLASFDRPFRPSQLREGDR